MSRYTVPPTSTISSTGSTVVPETSETTARCCWASLFSSEDLPTFGFPTIATRRGPPTSSKLSRGASGRTASTASRRSPEPLPCMAETGYGSPSPRFHMVAAMASWRWSSTLFAASTTGFLERLSTLTTASSSSRVPTVASTTNSTASAIEIASSACSAICCAMPLASETQPPVSTSTNSRPFQFASYETRSRVTPGTSCTTASLRPRMRLTSVDLPTFGRPTTATTGLIVDSSLMLRLLSRTDASS